MEQALTRNFLKFQRAKGSRRGDFLKKEHFSPVTCKIAFIINEDMTQSKAVLLSFYQGGSTSRAEMWEGRNCPNQGSPWLEAHGCDSRWPSVATLGQVAWQPVARNQQGECCESEPPNTGRVCVVLRGKTYSSPDHLTEAMSQISVNKLHKTGLGLSSSEEMFP